MKRNLRKILILALVFLCIILTNRVYAENNEAELLESEVHKEWRKLSDKEKAKTIEPPFYSTHFNTSTATYKTSRINMLNSLKSSLGSKYNLNDDIEVKVKDQGQTNRCWAFSLNSVLETTIAKTIKNTTYKIFSPAHMDYWVYNNYNTDFNHGGDSRQGLAYYTSGNGPIVDSDELTKYIDDHADNKKHTNSLSYPDTYISNFKSDYQVETYTQFPEIYKRYSGYDENYSIIYSNENLKYEDSNFREYNKEKVIEIRNAIKEHIQKNGAVTGITYVGNSGLSGSSIFYKYYDEENYSYFCNESNKFSMDHQVTIVGWDDNFSKEKFKITPPGDGAYIVLNSWGENMMNKGYYYISYYDCLIESNVYGINAVSNKNYDNIYQYDLLGRNAIIIPPETYNSSEIYVLNAFSKKGKNEYLTKVGFYLHDILNVDIYYAKWDKTNKKISGEKQLIKSLKASDISKNGYFTYYTYNLDEDEYVKIDDSFAIILRYYYSDSTQKGVCFPIEAPMSADVYGAENDIWKKAESIGNCSFYSLNAINWTDVANVKVNDLNMKNADICLKSFTLNLDNINVKSVSLNLEKSEMNEGDTLQLTATVSPKTATNKEITWTSSNEEVAKVDENGKVTAISAGKATITVTTKDQAKTASCEITVNEKKKDILVTQIDLDANQKEIYIGDKFKINATITPDNATNKELTWETEDKSIATVSSDGTVTGKAKGKVTIKVTNKVSGKSAVCVVTVLDKKEDEYYKEQEEKIVENTNNTDNTDNQENTLNNDAEEIQTTDDTTYGAVIPQTGIKTGIKIVLILILSFGTISFVKFYRRRDIK